MAHKNAEPTSDVIQLFGASSMTSIVEFSTRPSTVKSKNIGFAQNVIDCSDVEIWRSSDAIADDAEVDGKSAIECVVLLSSLLNDLKFEFGRGNFDAMTLLLARISICAQKIDLHETSRLAARIGESTMHRRSHSVAQLITLLDSLVSQLVDAYFTRAWDDAN